MISAASEIKTPLSFLALTILITEGILFALVRNAEGFDFTILVIAMTLLPFAVLIVFHSLFKNSVNTRVREGHYAAIKVVDFVDDEINRKEDFQVDIMGIKGTWKSTWYLEESDEPYVKDHIWIEGIRNNKVYGKGIDDKGTYEFEGFYIRGILTLVYKYVDKGYSLAGVIVLKIGPLAKKAHGKWYGFLVEGDINGGDVKWEQVSKNILDTSELNRLDNPQTLH